MKYVVVPKPITLLNPLTKKPAEEAKPREEWAVADRPEFRPMQPVTAYKFVFDYVLTSQLIGKGAEGVRRVMKLDAAFDGAEEGAIIGIEDADYTKVVEILKELSFQDPRVGAQLFPHFESWEKAANQDEEWKRKQTLKSVEG